MSRATVKFERTNFDEVIGGERDDAGGLFEVVDVCLLAVDDEQGAVSEGEAGAEGPEVEVPEEARPDDGEEDVHRENHGAEGGRTAWTYCEGSSSCCEARMAMSKKNSGMNPMQRVRMARLAMGVMRRT